MKRLIEAFIAKFWCCHKWELYKQINIFETPKSEFPHATKQILICEKCGEIKNVKL
jgi:Fe2+ or Zn2+ uptake regulation protein